MKNQLITLVLLLTALSSAATLDLPGYARARELTFSPIAEGAEVSIDIVVTLPPGQKLNKWAPSAVSVYERSDGSWNKTAQIPLHQLMFLKPESIQEISVAKKVKLKAAKGDLAVGATVYHCAEDGTLCMIEAYKGQVERKTGLSANRIPINLQGTLPRY